MRFTVAFRSFRRAQVAKKVSAIFLGHAHFFQLRAEQMAHRVRAQAGLGGASGEQDRFKLIVKPVAHWRPAGRREQIRE